MVRKIWETLSSRGYFPEGEEDIDMGYADSEDVLRMNGIIKEAVLAAIHRYEKRKKELDALDISDIQLEMDQLMQRDIPHFQDLSLKYLFVDEFQDTDNSQIRSIVWLVKKLGCYLLAVGDVKQSIYRFRGASDTAFGELEISMTAQGMSVWDYSLRINYRSDPRILRELNRYFAKWNEKGYLSYEAKDHVEAGISPFYQTDQPVEVIETDEGDEREERFAADVKRLRGERPGDSICVLCRNNYDVTRCAEVLRGAGISCHAKLRGGFYSTPPVNDLYALLGALLYPNDPVRLFNYLLCSYAGGAALDGAELSRRAGNTKEILRYLEKVRDQKEPGEWEKAQADIKTLPAFVFLREYGKRHDPVAGYNRSVVAPRGGSAEDQAYKLEQYQLNLDKLFRLLYEHFAGDFPTLDDIYSYLTILRTTGDTTEDALYPADGSTEAVLVMTVHKAKGLEFDHVFLPLTGNHFFRKDSLKAGHGMEILTEGHGLPVKIGWHLFLTGGSGDQRRLHTYENRYYENMRPGERSAVLGEETRVLYVALTRACRSLHIYKKPRQEGTDLQEEPDTWNGLLDQGMGF